MPKLINLARADAKLGQTDLYDFSSIEVEIPEIKLDKTSDALDGVWVGDVLTYTVRITNLNTSTAVTGIKFTDTIDPALARLIETSVVVDGQNLTIGDQFTYNTTSGTLTIPNPDEVYVMPDVEPEESYTVTFQVTKV